MRVWAVAILLAAGAVWFFWPSPTRERGERREVLPERVVVPPSKAPEPVVEPALSKPPHGFVLGPDGEPVVDAQVRLNGSDPIPTDATGRYEFEWPKDAKRVDFRIKHHAHLDAGGERGADESFDFTMERGLSVSGRVVFPDGSPVPDWYVIGRCADEMDWDASSMSTDEDGRFELSGLRPGRVNVRINDGTDWSSLECDAGTTNLRFVVRLSVLRVFLIKPDGAYPRAARIQLGQHVEEIPELSPDARTKTPFVEEVEPGSDVELTAVVRGFRTIRRRIPAWSKIPRLHDERIQLEPAGTGAVLLDVWLPGANRPDNLVVQLVGQGRTINLDTISDWPVRIDDLVPGPVVLRVHAGKEFYLAREFTVVASEREPQPTNVELPPGAQVRIHAPDLAEYIGIQPVHGEKMFQTFRSGKDYVVMGKVPEGNYILFASKDGKRTREVEVTVKGTKENKFDWAELSR